MGQLTGPAPDFAGLFASPSIERMLDELNDHEFEHFVAYVFEQAGYTVEDTAYNHGSGLDLKVYSGPSRSLHAGVQVKHWVPGHKVGAPEIVSLRGGLPENPHVTGYLVTTSTFAGPAIEEAQSQRRIWPIDGAHFIRYIHYVRGTRHIVDPATPPEATQAAGVFPPFPPESLLTADDIYRRPTTETKVLTVANHKGGVGKTTTALNLAFGLAAQDKQVLLVDLDAQANLTSALAYPRAKDAVPRQVGDYFNRPKDLARFVSPTAFDRIWLIPAGHELMHADRGLGAGPAAELQFARDLHAAELVPPEVLDKRPFDWIIIDTGPWMGYFTRSALAASHYVLVPISPGVFADMGINLLLDTVGTMQALTGRRIEILGYLVTQWTSNALNKALLAKAEALLALARIPRIQTEIPLDKSNIEKAHLETGQGKSRNLFDRKCASAKAYLAVVEEVLGYVNARN